MECVVCSVVYGTIFGLMKRMDGLVKICGVPILTICWIQCDLSSLAMMAHKQINMIINHGSLGVGTTVHLAKGVDMSWDLQQMVVHGIDVWHLWGHFHVFVTNERMNDFVSIVEII